MHFQPISTLPYFQNRRDFTQAHEKHTSYSLLNLLFLVLLALLGPSVVYSHVRAEYIASEEIERLEGVMFTEHRRGHVMEIRSGEPLESEAEDNAALFRASGIEGTSGDEILLIDWEVIPYIRTSEEYHIYYQPPEANLPSAAVQIILSHLLYDNN